MKEISTNNENGRDEDLNVKNIIEFYEIVELQCYDKLSKIFFKFYKINK